MSKRWRLQRDCAMASMINRRFVCWLFIWFSVRFAYKLHVRTSKTTKHVVVGCMIEVSNFGWSLSDRRTLTSVDTHSVWNVRNFISCSALGKLYSFIPERAFGHIFSSRHTHISSCFGGYTTFGWFFVLCTLCISHSRADFINWQKKGDWLQWVAYLLKYIYVISII